MPASKFIGGSDNGRLLFRGGGALQHCPWKDLVPCQNKQMRDCPAENKTCSGGELSFSSYLIQEPIGRANMGRNHACGVVLQASPGQRGSARDEIGIVPRFPLLPEALIWWNF